MSRCQRLVSKQLICLVILVTLLATAAPVSAISFGGPGGKWPKSWPRELESLRRQAWTWEHGFCGTSYDIPFQDRQQFEALWPLLMQLKSKDASLTLRRGNHLRVDGSRAAGVQVFLPLQGVATGPQSMTRMVLVVDGDIVDLNRIPLPADCPVIDQRFEK